MKILFLSDIHGVPSALEAAFAAADGLGYDKIVLLGDLLYHGPRNGVPSFYDPAKVAAMLNARKDAILAVRGNCDAEVDQMVLAFDVTTEHRHVELLGRKVLMTHGHHVNIDALPSPELRQGAEILLYGHTHVPLWERREGLLCLNPGSVSIPKNGSPRGCILAEDEGLRWLTLAGEEYHRLAW